MEFLYFKSQLSIIMASENIIKPIPIQLVLGTRDLIERESLAAAPYNFTISTEGKWEMLVCAEDVEVKKGSVIEISVKETVIQENTVALPCAFCHHAMGAVLKVQHIGVALVETKRKITSVIFLPIMDGMIEKGDLLAVINVFPIVLNK